MRRIEDKCTNPVSVVLSPKFRLEIPYNVLEELNQAYYSNHREKVENGTEKLLIKTNNEGKLESYLFSKDILDETYHQLSVQETKKICQLCLQFVVISTLNNTYSLYSIESARKLSKDYFENKAEYKKGNRKSYSTPNSYEITLDEERMALTEYVELSTIRIENICDAYFLSIRRLIENLIGKHSVSFNKYTALTRLDKEEATMEIVQRVFARLLPAEYIKKKIFNYQGAFVKMLDSMVNFCIQDAIRDYLNEHATVYDTNILDDDEKINYIRTIYENKDIPYDSHCKPENNCYLAGEVGFIAKHLMKDKKNGPLDVIIFLRLYEETHNRNFVNKVSGPVFREEICTCDSFHELLQIRLNNCELDTRCIPSSLITNGEKYFNWYKMMSTAKFDYRKKLIVETLKEIYQISNQNGLRLVRR